MIPQETSSTLAVGSRVVKYACEASGAQIIDVIYPGDTDFDTHIHQEAYLCLALHGSYDEWSEDGRGSVVMGTKLVYRGGSQHAVRTGSAGARMLHLTDPVAEDWAGTTAPTTTGLLWQMAVTIGAFGHRPPDDADRLHIESLVFELRPGRRLDPNASWLDSVRARLREEYRHRVTLDDLAGAEGRHPAHLARAFKSRWGMTTGDFLRRVRVTAAVRLLRETDAPLSVVAVEAGFSDQSHMGRWLRRYVGLTPGNVRASRGRPTWS